MLFIFSSWQGRICPHSIQHTFNSNLLNFQPIVSGARKRIKSERFILGPLHLRGNRRGEGLPRSLNGSSCAIGLLSIQLILYGYFRSLPIIADTLRLSIGFHRFHWFCLLHSSIPNAVIGCDGSNQSNPRRLSSISVPPGAYASFEPYKFV